MYYLERKHLWGTDIKNVIRLARFMELIDDSITDNMITSSLGWQRCLIEIVVRKTNI